MLTAPEPSVIVVSPKGDVVVEALSPTTADEGPASSEWNVVEDPTERMSQTIKDMQSEISKMKKKARKDSKAHKGAMETLARRVENIEDRVENMEDRVDYLSAAVESKMGAVGDIMKFYMDDQTKLGSVMVDHLRAVENDLALAGMRAERCEEDITQIQQITLRVFDDVSILKNDMQKPKTEGFYWDGGDMHSKYNGMATDTLDGWFEENEPPQESDRDQHDDYNYDNNNDNCNHSTQA